MGARDPAPPRASRRGRVRSLHQRRRRHPHPDPARVLRARRSGASASSSRSRATTASRSASSRATRRGAAAQMRMLEDGRPLPQPEGHRLARRARRRRASSARSARESMPVMKQLFIGRMCAGERVRAHALHDPQARRAAGARDEAHGDDFYVASCSSKTVVYKGLALPERLADFYRDLARTTTSQPPRARPLALLDEHVPDVGARASRTGASRTTARSTRCAATRTGCARARRSSRAPLFGEHIADFKPIIRPGGSDSASLDNVVDFLVAGGRSLPHVMMMLVPEAWATQADMPPERARVLRVPRVARRAVGRAGGARLHRRRRRRRDARPQRPAPGEVRRHRRAGSSSWRASSACSTFDADGRRREGPPPARARCSSSTSRASARRRATRRSSSEVATRKPYARVGRRATSIDLAHRCRDVTALYALERRRARARSQRAFGYTREDLRVLLAPMADARRRADRAAWATTPRSPCSAIARSCSSATSSSSSRRSRTRRSIRSARSS